MFIIFIIVVYLLIGLFVFLRDLNTVLNRNNLKFSNIKKLNFNIDINGIKYYGYKAYIMSILTWPFRLNVYSKD